MKDILLTIDGRSEDARMVAVGGSGYSKLGHRYRLRLRDPVDLELLSHVGSSDLVPENAEDDLLQRVSKILGQRKISPRPADYTLCTRGSHSPMAR